MKRFGLILLLSIIAVTFSSSTHPTRRMIAKPDYKIRSRLLKFTRQHDNSDSITPQSTGSQIEIPENKRKVIVDMLKDPSTTSNKCSDTCIVHSILDNSKDNTILYICIVVAIVSIGYCTYIRIRNDRHVTIDTDNNELEMKIIDNEVDVANNIQGMPLKSVSQEPSVKYAQFQNEMNIYQPNVNPTLLGITDSNKLDSKPFSNLKFAESQPNSGHLQSGEIAFTPCFPILQEHILAPINEEEDKEAGKSPGSFKFSNAISPDTKGSFAAHARLPSISSSTASLQNSYYNPKKIGSLLRKIDSDGKLSSTEVSPSKPSPYLGFYQRQFTDGGKPKIKKENGIKRQQSIKEQGKTKSAQKSGALSQVSFS